MLKIDDLLWDFRLKFWQGYVRRISGKLIRVFLEQIRVSLLDGLTSIERAGRIRLNEQVIFAARIEKYVIFLKMLAFYLEYFYMCTQKTRKYRAKIIYLQSRAKSWPFFLDFSEIFSPILPT